MRWLLIGLVLLLPALAHAALLDDRAAVIDNPEAIQTILDELQDKTGVRLWVVTRLDLPAMSDDIPLEIAATQLLQQLDSQTNSREPGAQTPGQSLLLLLLTESKLLAIKSGPQLNIPARELNEIQKRIIIPRLRENDFQAALLNGSQALANLVGRHMGISLSFAEVDMERGSRWWQRVPLEPKHLWLPGLLVVWYIIMKIRKKKNG